MAEGDQPQHSANRRVVEIVVGLLVIALFAWAYIYVLRAFYREAEKRFDVIVAEDGLGADFFDAKMTVTAVDPIKGELNARIEFEPKGKLVGEDGFVLARDVTLSVNSVKGKQLENYKKGTRLAPIDITLALFDGEAMEYPFDAHKAELNLDLTTIVKTRTTGENGEAVEEEDEVFFPVAMQFEASAPGFRFDVENVKSEKGHGFSSADLEIARSPTVKGFSIFIMALIWSICLTILTMSLAVWLRGRKLEFSMLTFIAAMLFAFPAIRNLQPMVPPIGALPDFIAVFWAQGITGMCLVIMLGVWLARPVKG